MSDYPLPLPEPTVQRRSAVWFAVVAIHGLILFGFLHEMSHSLVGVVQPVSLNLIPAQEFAPEKHDTAVIKHSAPVPHPKIETPVVPPVPPPVVQPPVESITTNPLPVTASALGGKTKGQDLGPESAGGQTHRSVAISQLTILFSPNPSSYYPAISKKLEEEGRVQLRIFINEKGLVESTEVIRSSQSTRLDAAAARLARDTRFKPYAPEGTPIRISALLTVSFRLTH